MKEIKILELFGGIGAIRKAFERQNIPHKVVDYVEIDKFAVDSYNAMFNENYNIADIKQWDKQIDVDFIMHGSPCQDFSVAGKQAGGDLGSGTRSSLMYETIRIVGKLRPKYVIWENVKNLLSKKHKHNFEAYIETMNILGYNSYHQVLNAKDYGIPQNRERVYTVSIRKDIDKDTFKFPEKEELKLRLKDILEAEVDEKYYLDNAKIEKITNSNFMQEKKRIQEKEICDTLLARDWKDPKCVQVGTLDIKGHDSIKRIYSQEGISPTLTDMQGGNRQPKIAEENFIEKKYNDFIEKNGYIPEMFNPYNESEIKDIAPTQSTQCGSTTSSATILIKNATKKGYEEAIGGDSINLQYLGSKTRRGRVGHQVSQTLMANDSMGVVEEIKVIGNYMPSNHDASRIVDSNGLDPTVKENHGTVKVTNINYRIRKLTPLECWRLMRI